MSDLIEIICCPVDDCDWATDATPPEVPPKTLAAVFGQGVMAAAAQSSHLAEIERQLEEHYRLNHTTADYLRTITRLRSEAERQGDLIEELRKQLTAAHDQLDRRQQLERTNP